MNESEYSLLREQITKLEATVDRIQSRMVTKSEFSQVAKKVDRHEANIAENESLIAAHHEAYCDYVKGRKWLVRLGLGTIASAWVSPHVVPIAKGISEIFKWGLK
jgi:prefoldin subunit 5